MNPTGRGGLGERPRTAASLARRVGALLIDWLAAVAISAGFFDYHPFATLAVFFVMTTVLVGTAGLTIGHLATGIGVRRLDGGPPLLGRSLLRTAALCLVLPAVVWTAEGRGLHDVWAGTRIVRLR